jgi:hypothetical protein
MKPDIKHLTCQICSAQIPPGGVFYTVRTEIISGSDGILPDSDDSGDKIIEEALKEISRSRAEQEFMDEVYQEINIVVCGQCRLTFRETVLDMIQF